MVLFSIGAASGWYMRRAWALRNFAAPKLPRQIREKGHIFTNPLLFCEAYPSETSAFQPLETKMAQYAAEYQNKKKVTSFSAYFRDLTSGRWIGVNDIASYDPASLLKVPLLIAYLKEAENDPGLLSKKLLYPGETGNDGQQKEFYHLQPNTRYAINDLLGAMIVESDNAAKDLLFSAMNLTTQNEIFSDLGIQIIQNLNSPYTISAKNYGLFFRILYNATYLNREMSEKALELLSRANFKDGIVASVPQGTPVAHKFGQYGERDTTSPTGETWELHDCGIVYNPSRPYLLCVMTRGADLGALKSLIQGISKIAYQEVENNYKN